MRKLGSAAAMLGALAAASIASAQTAQNPNQPNEPSGPAETMPPPSTGALNPTVNQGPNLSVAAGAGVSHLGRDLASQTSAGPAYGVTATINPTGALGYDIGYLGAVNGNGSPLAANSNFVTNLGKTDVRLNLMPDQRVRPYLDAGVGIAHIGETGTSPGEQAVNSFVIPLGAGVQTDLTDRFSLGAEFNYNTMFSKDIRPGASTNTDLWDAAVTLGAKLR